MAWDDELIDEQRRAASHETGHARLLAGPGTGKTRVLTRRILYLVTEAGVPPEDIVALTFTRSAAFELRNRVKASLGERENYPFVSTLHSFALRNLLYNSQRLDVLPQPLRIADDWEERHIIEEDIRSMLGADRIRDVKGHFGDMETDYSNLVHDTPAAEADAAFLGAWQEHREIYGYTLRSELIYRLNRALEQVGDFQLSPHPEHLLVDEFQDLNACDISVIKEISERGVDVYGAGDDDQSIYGFRSAAPEAIRNYGQHFDPFEDLPLEICHRCDQSIVNLAEFVADLDIEREDKEFRPRPDADEGEVRILRFRDQAIEAAAVAWLCEYLTSEEGFDPSDILVLLRSDHRQAFSSPLADAINGRGISVNVNSGGGLPIDTDLGREVVAALRLCVNDGDSLAWRASFQARSGNGIGGGSIEHLNDYARARGVRFAEAIEQAAAEGALTPYLQRTLPDEVQRVEAVVDGIRDECPVGVDDDAQETNDDLSVDEFQERLRGVIESAFAEQDQDKLEEVIRFLEQSATETGAVTVSSLINGLSTLGAAPEQELKEGAVNILTMHKAKGLTAPAVIVAAAEDEYIPGKNETRPERDDERRLLYVSLTRAKSFLFVTYCDTRTNNQQYRGRRNPQAPIARTLTRFLREQDRVRPENGLEYLEHLDEQTA